MKLLPDGRAQTGHAALVPGRAGVVQLHRRDHGVDHLSRRRPQPGGGFLQFVFAGQQLLLGALALADVLLELPPVFLLYLERLPPVGRHEVGHQGKAGDDEQRQVVEPGHPIVCEPGGRVREGRQAPEDEGRRGPEQEGRAHDRQRVDDEQPVQDTPVEEQRRGEQDEQQAEPRGQRGAAVAIGEPGDDQAAQDDGAHRGVLRRAGVRGVEELREAQHRRRRRRARRARG